MAENYRETIADMLQAYDNYSRSYEFYMDLSWEGLMSNRNYTNVAWENLDENEKERIIGVVLNYIESEKFEGCQ